MKYVLIGLFLIANVLFISCNGYMRTSSASKEQELLKREHKRFTGISKSLKDGNMHKSGKSDDLDTGICDHPDDLDSLGRRCGKRAASEKSGGR